jgi:hypothetical protein
MAIYYGCLEYFTDIWYIFWPFGNLVATWDSFPRFGLLCQEKSGNPEQNAGFSLFLLAPTCMRTLFSPEKSSCNKHPIIYLFFCCRHFGICQTARHLHCRNLADALFAKVTVGSMLDMDHDYRLRHILHSKN